MDVGLVIICVICFIWAFLSEILNYLVYKYTGVKKRRGIFSLIAALLAIPFAFIKDDEFR